MKSNTIKGCSICLYLSIVSNNLTENHSYTGNTSIAVIKHINTVDSFFIVGI